MKRTYIDANVLIAAFQGEEQAAQKALRVLDDPDRKFVVSDYLRIEVLPKPAFHKRDDEVEFMQTVFENAENWKTSPELTRQALALATKYDLTALDALHLGAASLAGVDEFVTMEKPSKPMCKVKEVLVVSIHEESGTSPGFEESKISPKKG
jgi:hypothetical protein